MKITGGSIRTFFYAWSTYKLSVQICTHIMLILANFLDINKLIRFILMNEASPFCKNEQRVKNGYHPAFYNPTE